MAWGRATISGGAKTNGADGGKVEDEKKPAGKTEAEKEAEALEREMEAMGRDVERLRIEADEDLARRMAEEGY